MTSSNKPIILTLLYPATQKFDMNYYLTTHMPMASKHMTPHGLTKWEVVQADPASGYSTLCFLHFKDKEGADKAFASAQDVLADIPNYTDVKPVSVGGLIVGSGQI